MEPILLIASLGILWLSIALLHTTPTRIKIRYPPGLLFGSVFCSMNRSQDNLT